MKQFFSLLAGGLLLAGTAHAQATRRFGPQVGIVRATVYNTSATKYYTLAGRSGLEAGLAGSLLLYSQQGYASEQLPLAGGPAFGTAATRLDYLRAPLQVAYTQHADGQGLQLFAGPYLGFLLGGRTESSYGTNRDTGGVVVTEAHTERISSGSSTIRYPDYNFYGRRLDLGGR